jgi:hypothetical protein
LIFLLFHDLARNPSNRFESRLIETSKKIIRFRFSLSLSHFPVKPPIDCDQIDASLRTQNTIPVGLLFRAGERVKRNENSQNGCELKKLEINFLMPNLLPLFATVHFIFFHLSDAERIILKMCATRSAPTQAESFGGREEDEVESCVVCMKRNVGLDRGFNQGGREREGEMNNELRNGPVLN